MAGVHLDTSRRLARAAFAPDPTGRPPLVTPRLFACRALFLTDDGDEAEAHLATLLNEAHRRRAAISLAHVLAVRADLHIRHGRPDAAARDLAAAEAELPLAGLHPLFVPYWASLNLVADLRNGRTDRAREVASRPVPLLAEECATSAYLLFARGVLARSEDDPHRAREYFRACGRWLLRYGCVNPAVLPWRSLAAEAAHALGDSEEALRLTREELRLAARWGTRSAVGRAELSLAVVVGENRAEHFRAAVATLSESPARATYTRAVIELASAERAEAERRSALALTSRRSRSTGDVPLIDAFTQTRPAPPGRPPKQGGPTPHGTPPHTPGRARADWACAEPRRTRDGAPRRPRPGQPGDRRGPLGDHPYGGTAPQRRLPQTPHPRTRGTARTQTRIGGQLIHAAGAQHRDHPGRRRARRRGRRTVLPRGGHRPPRHRPLGAAAAAVRARRRARRRPGAAGQRRAHGTGLRLRRRAAALRAAPERLAAGRQGPLDGRPRLLRPARSRRRRRLARRRPGHRRHRSRTPRTVLPARQRQRRQQAAHPHRRPPLVRRALVALAHLPGQAAARTASRHRLRPARRRPPYPPRPDPRGARGRHPDPAARLPQPGGRPHPGRRELRRTGRRGIRPGLPRGVRGKPPVPDVDPGRHGRPRPPPAGRTRRHHPQAQPLPAARAHREHPARPVGAGTRPRRRHRHPRRTGRRPHPDPAGQTRRHRLLRSPARPGRPRNARRRTRTALHPPRRRRRRGVHPHHGPAGADARRGRRTPVRLGQPRRAGRRPAHGRRHPAPALGRRRPALRRRHRPAARSARHRRPLSAARSPRQPGRGHRPRPPAGGTRHRRKGLRPPRLRTAHRAGHGPAARTEGPCGGRAAHLTHPAGPRTAHRRRPAAAGGRACPPLRIAGNFLSP
ncbi:hypothetical protein SALBM135S_01065 [Streptomyces alboniger]